MISFCAKVIENHQFVNIMDVLPTNQILEFQPDSLEAVRKIHGFEEQKHVSDVVDDLEHWVQKQSHFRKKYCRHYLETTIIASKGSFERAKKRLENVCRLRTQQPQFFGNFHMQHDFKDFHGVMTYAILPKLTRDYNRILLIKCTGKHFQSNLILQFTRICIIIFEYLKVKDYSDGVIAVVDLTQVSLLETIRRICLQDLRQAASILIEGYGVRVRGLHVISKSKIINAFVWIFKQVLNAKLISRIHVHRSIKTILNFIPEDIMPNEYGGKEKSFESIHQEWVSVLSSEEFRDYLAEINGTCGTTMTTTVT